jgi:dethiobiotin synthetase
VSVAQRGPVTAAWRGPVVVTGTDTAVGKTIATAAIAATATAAGLRVAVVKPAQTGAGGGAEPDASTVRRLAGPATAVTVASYRDPLAPLVAAEVSGQPALELDRVLTTVQDLGGGHDLVLVEGAGGVLVPIGVGGWTVADLALALAAPAVIVARSGLGTLNHTALTLEAAERRGLTATVLIGAWPNRPELVHRTNARHLPGDLVGVLPDLAGGLAPAAFRVQAAGWVAPRLHGTFDPVSFRATCSLR